MQDRVVIFGFRVRFYRITIRPFVKTKPCQSVQLGLRRRSVRALASEVTASRGVDSNIRHRPMSSLSSSSSSSSSWHCNPIFVYGTLKRNQPNHNLLQTAAEFIGQTTTVERWPLIVYGPSNAPYLLDCKGIGHVRRPTTIP